MFGLHSGLGFAYALLVSNVWAFVISHPDSIQGYTTNLWISKLGVYDADLFLLQAKFHQEVKLEMEIVKMN
jgi:hypothetical protein